MLGYQSFFFFSYYTVEPLTWGHVDGGVDRANIGLRSHRVVAALVETSVGLVLRGED